MYTSDRLYSCFKSGAQPLRLLLFSFQLKTGYNGSLTVLGCRPLFYINSTDLFCCSDFLLFEFLFYYFLNNFAYFSLFYSIYLFFEYIYIYLISLSVNSFIPLRVKNISTTYFKFRPRRRPEGISLKSVLWLKDHNTVPWAVV